MQFSTQLRDARNDAIATAIGPSPKLQIFNGNMPGATYDNNVYPPAPILIAEGVLPVDWILPSSGGVKGKKGTWSVTGLAAAGLGTSMQFFRLLDSTGFCHILGRAGALTALSPVEMRMANNTIAYGQVVTFNGFAFIENYSVNLNLSIPPI